MPTALFVSHSFPPAGGSGSARAAKFARYLPSFGWRPVVLTVEKGRIGQLDPSLEAEIPDWLPVRRARSFEPRGYGSIPAGQQGGSAAVRSESAMWRAVRRARRRLNAGLAHACHFPDRHNTWAPDAVRQGLAAIRRYRVDLLYSSAAPFTNHLVALALHGMTGLPLVLELRDGWQRWNSSIFPDYPSWRGRVEGGLERFAFRHAARVVLVTEQSAEAFRGQYPDLDPERFTVVPNGFDRRDFVGPIPPSNAEDCAIGLFTIVHAGSLYYGRSCADALDAVQRLANARPDFAARARLRLIGNLDQTAQAEIDRMRSEHVGSGLVEVLPYVPHAQIVSHLRAASVLLLIVNTTAGGGTAVPGKLYEYLAAERPILCIAPEGAEAAAIVERTRAGVVVNAGDPAALEREIGCLFERWTSGTLAADRCEQEVSRYDRLRLTADLAGVFDTALRADTCAVRASRRQGR